MTTKEYLRQIYRYERMINNNLAEIYQLRTLASNISIALTPDKVQTSGNKDTLGNTMAKIYDLEREVDVLVDNLYKQKKIIVKQIESMLKHNDDRHEEYYDVLTARFVRCMTFEEIPSEIGMSERKMYYIYNEALKEFEKMYGETYLKREMFAVNCS